MIEQIEKCRCESGYQSAKRSKSRKMVKSKKILGRKIMTLKNVLLGVYKTEKCYDAISRPKIRERVG